MTAYADYLAAPTRTPVWLVILTLDFCENTFGSSPCTATGIPCYNTYPTCRDRLNYVRGTKDYMYTSLNAPLPFPGPRRHISGIDFFPTEIKTSLTVNNRIKIRMLDELCGDIGIDPYVADRDSVQGTHWKKLIARNGGNYKGRPCKAYHGFIGMTLEEFLAQQRFLGDLDNINIETGGGIIIEAVDPLKKLSDTELPPKLNTKLVAAMGVDDETATLNDTSELPASGIVKIGDEIIEYDSKNDTTNQLLDLTRSAWDTEAAEHKEKDKVQICEYFPWDNPYEHAQTILTKSSIAAGNIDSSAFDALKTFPEADIDYRALVTEPTKADKLYFELMDHLDCKSWTNEDLKITVEKVLANRPGRSYTEITDNGNIAAKTGQADLNQISLVTRYALYWDLKTNGKLEEPASYSCLAVSPEAEAESENENNTIVEKTIYSRWIHQNTPGVTEEALDEYVELLITRLTRNHRDALHLVPLSVELKDEALRTGSYVHLSSDILLNPDGTALDAAPHQIIKREPKGRQIDLVLMEQPRKKIAYWAPDDLPDYGDADPDDKEYGFWCDDNGFMPDGIEGWHFY